MRIGILGYGNLAKGVECAIGQNDDLELTAVFTRRNPESVKVITPGVHVYNTADILEHKDDIDVLIICSGSATDMPKQTPEYAKYFNVVDSFDTHARIPSTLQMLIRQQRKLAIQHLFLQDGILVCSQLTVFIQNVSYLKVSHTHSGVRV